MRAMSPCYECADRYAGCHSVCERYLEYKQKFSAYHEEVQRAREHEHVRKSDSDQRRYYQSLMKKRK